CHVRRLPAHLVPGWLSNGGDPCPLRTTCITPLHDGCEASAPSGATRTLGLAVGPACLGIADQVLTFRTRATLSFALPTCQMPLGLSQVPPKLIPGDGSTPVLTLTTRN